MKGWVDPQRLEDVSVPGNAGEAWATQGPSVNGYEGTRTFLDREAVESRVSIDVKGVEPVAAHAALWSSARHTSKFYARHGSSWAGVRAPKLFCPVKGKSLA